MDRIKGLFMPRKKRNVAFEDEWDRGFTVWCEPGFHQVIRQIAGVVKAEELEDFPDALEVKMDPRFDAQEIKKAILDLVELG